MNARSVLNFVPRLCALALGLFLICFEARGMQQPRPTEQAITQLEERVERTLKQPSLRLDQQTKLKRDLENLKKYRPGKVQHYEEQIRQKSVREPERKSPSISEQKPLPDAPKPKPITKPLPNIPTKVPEPEPVAEPEEIDDTEPEIPDNAEAEDLGVDDLSSILGQLGANLMKVDEEQQKEAKNNPAWSKQLIANINAIKADDFKDKPQQAIEQVAELEKMTPQIPAKFISVKSAINKKIAQLKAAVVLDQLTVLDVIIRTQRAALRPIADMAQVGSAESQIVLQTAQEVAASMQQISAALLAANVDNPWMREYMNEILGIAKQWRVPKELKAVRARVKEGARALARLYHHYMAGYVMLLRSRLTLLKKEQVPAVQRAHAARSVQPLYEGMKLLVEAYASLWQAREKIGHLLAVETLTRQELQSAADRKDEVEKISAWVQQVDGAIAQFNQQWEAYQENSEQPVSLASVLAVEAQQQDAMLKKIAGALLVLIYVDQFVYAAEMFERITAFVESPDERIDLEWLSTHLQQRLGAAGAHLGAAQTRALLRGEDEHGAEFAPVVENIRAQAQRLIDACAQIVSSQLSGALRSPASLDEKKKQGEAVLAQYQKLHSLFEGLLLIDKGYKWPLPAQQGFENALYNLSNARKPKSSPPAKPLPPLPEATNNEPKGKDELEETIADQKDREARERAEKERADQDKMKRAREREARQREQAAQKKQEQEQRQAEQKRLADESKKSAEEKKKGLAEKRKAELERRNKEKEANIAAEKERKEQFSQEQNRLIEHAKNELDREIDRLNQAADACSKQREEIASINAAQIASEDTQTSVQQLKNAVLISIATAMRDISDSKAPQESLLAVEIERIQKLYPDVHNSGKNQVSKMLREAFNLFRTEAQALARDYEIIIKQLAAEIEKRIGLMAKRDDQYAREQLSVVQALHKGLQEIVPAVKGFGTFVGVSLAIEQYTSIDEQLAVVHEWQQKISAMEPENLAASMALYDQIEQINNGAIKQIAGKLIMNKTPLFVQSVLAAIFNVAQETADEIELRQLSPATVAQGLGAMLERLKSEAYLSSARVQKALAIYLDRSSSQTVTNVQTTVQDLINSSLENVEACYTNLREQIVRLETQALGKKLPSHSAVGEVVTFANDCAVLGKQLETAITQLKQWHLIEDDTPAHKPKKIEQTFNNLPIHVQLLALQDKNPLLSLLMISERASALSEPKMDGTNAQEFASLQQELAKQQEAIKKMSDAAQKQFLLERASRVQKSLLNMWANYVTALVALENGRAQQLPSVEMLKNSNNQHGEFVQGMKQLESGMASFARYMVSDVTLLDRLKEAEKYGLPKDFIVPVKSAVSSIVAAYDQRMLAALENLQHKHDALTQVGQTGLDQYLAMYAAAEAARIEYEKTREAVAPLGVSVSQSPLFDIFKQPKKENISNALMQAFEKQFEQIREVLSDAQSSVWYVFVADPAKASIDFNGYLEPFEKIEKGENPLEQSEPKTLSEAQKHAILNLAVAVRLLIMQRQLQYAAAVLRLHADALQEIKEVNELDTLVPQVRTRLVDEARMPKVQNPEKAQKELDEARVQAQRARELYRQHMKQVRKSLISWAGEKENGDQLRRWRELAQKLDDFIADLAAWKILEEILRNEFLLYMYGIELEGISAIFEYGIDLLEQKGPFTGKPKTDEIDKKVTEIKNIFDDTKLLDRMKEIASLQGIDKELLEQIKNKAKEWHDTIYKMLGFKAEQVRKEIADGSIEALLHLKALNAEVVNAITFLRNQGLVEPNYMTKSEREMFLKLVELEIAQFMATLNTIKPETATVDGIKILEEIKESKSISTVQEKINQLSTQERGLGSEEAVKPVRTMLYGLQFLYLLKAVSISAKEALEIKVQTSSREQKIEANRGLISRLDAWLVAARVDERFKTYLSGNKGAQDDLQKLSANLINTLAVLRDEYQKEQVTPIESDLNKQDEYNESAEKLERYNHQIMSVVKQLQDSTLLAPSFLVADLQGSLDLQKQVHASHIKALELRKQIDKQVAKAKADWKEELNFIDLMHQIEAAKTAENNKVQETYQKNKVNDLFDDLARHLDRSMIDYATAKFSHPINFSAFDQSVELVNRTLEQMGTGEPSFTKLIQEIDGATGEFETAYTAMQEPLAKMRKTLAEFAGNYYEAALSKLNSGRVSQLTFGYLGSKGDREMADEFIEFGNKIIKEKLVTDQKVTIGSAQKTVQQMVHDLQTRLAAKE